MVGKRLVSSCYTGADPHFLCDAVVLTAFQRAIEIYSPLMLAWRDNISIMHLSILIGSLLISTVCALWPVPIQVSEGNTTVVLAEGFAIEYNAPNGAKPDGCVDSSKRVWGAINRTYGLLNDGFIPNMLYTFEEDFEPTTEEMASAQQLSKLVITQTWIPLSRD